MWAREPEPCSRCPVPRARDAAWVTAVRPNHPTIGDVMSPDDYGIASVSRPPSRPEAAMGSRAVFGCGCRHRHAPRSVAKPRRVLDVILRTRGTRKHRTRHQVRLRYARCASPPPGDRRRTRSFDRGDLAGRDADPRERIEPATAYDAGGKVLAMQTVTLQPSVMPVVLDAQNISSVVITSTALCGVIDDVRYTLPTKTSALAAK